MNNFQSRANIARLYELFAMVDKLTQAEQDRIVTRIEALIAEHGTNTESGK